MANPIDSIQEFKVENGAKFERHTVNLDLSKGVSENRHPEFQKKTIFLSGIGKGRCPQGQIDTGTVLLVGKDLFLQRFGGV